MGDGGEDIPRHKRPSLFFDNEFVQTVQEQLVPVESHCVHRAKAIGVKTKPFQEQCICQPKAVSEFEKPNYAENLIQCLFDVALGDQKFGSKLVLGCDGRYPTEKLVQTALRMAAANGVAHIMIAQNGIMTAPAVSLAIRQYHADGGIYFTGGNLTAGSGGYLALRFNGITGGLVNASVQNEVKKATMTIKHFFISPQVRVNLTSVRRHEVVVEDVGPMIVDVFDSVGDYTKCMDRLFDFWLLRPLFSGSVTGVPVRILIDCMNGATGPYAYGLFHDHIGVFTEDHRRYKPLPDYGGLTPRPHPKNAEYLLEHLKKGVHDMGIALNAHGTQVMIITSNGFVVPPTEYLTIFAYNLQYIPYFRQLGGVKGFARTVGSPLTVDKVARKLKIVCHEVPNSWHYLEELMNNGLITMCSDEDYNIACNFLREPDALWTVLCWLTIFSKTKRSIQQNIKDIWISFGKNICCKLLYKNVDKQQLAKLMERLKGLIVSQEFRGKTFALPNQKLVAIKGEVYTYGSAGVATDDKESLRILFDGDSQLLFQTIEEEVQDKTVTNTLNIFVDRCVQDIKLHEVPNDQLLQPMIDLAIQISKLNEYIVGQNPTILTF